MNNNIEKFLGLLDAAGAVTIDDGALLTGCEGEKLTGDPDNQVVRFTWTDGECDYSDVLTEGGIAAGVFDSDGKFVAENSEGEKTVIRFFAVERLNDVSGKRAAAKFFRELLDSVETLSGIAVEHGARTLADLMYLQNAILNGGFIDHYPDESKVLEIASALPSGEQWSRFIKVEYMLAAEDEFTNLFNDVITYLIEYHSDLGDKQLAMKIKESVRQNHQNTGNTQTDYEQLRDAVEREIEGVERTDKSRL